MSLRRGPDIITPFTMSAWSPGTKLAWKVPIIQSRQMNPAHRTAIAFNY